jgi:hypothetical protein
MFPFTQISNLYTYLFYEEVKCQNKSCDRTMVVPKGNTVTHCSVGCGYEEYNQYCQQLKEKKKEIEKMKEKLKRRYTI